MRNIPRKDEDKKLLPQGVLNKKISMPSFNLTRQDGSIVSERFNEDVGMLMPINKKQKRSEVSWTAADVTKSSSQHNQPFLSHRETQSTSTQEQSKELSTKMLLARMGYNGMEPPGGHSLANSLLSSQREAYKNQKKSSIGGSTVVVSRANNPGLEESSLESLVWSVGKEQALQRFLSRAYGNARKRLELINSSDRFQADIKKKLEHWNQISSLIDCDIEQKLNEVPQVAQIAEKYVELNGYLAQIFKYIYNLYSETLNELDLQKDKITATEIKLKAMITQKDQVQDMLKEKNDILKKFIDMGANADEFRSKKVQRENYITFENSKLAAENSQLAEKLKVLESGQDITQLRNDLADLKAESEMKISKLLKEAELREREISKRKLQLTSLQASLSKLDLESRQQRLRIDDQEQELVVLRAQNIDLQAKYDQFRERALMGQEDYQGMLMKTGEQNSLLNSLREKSQALKAKLDKFTIARSKEVEIPSDGSFPNDQNMLKVMQAELIKDKTYFKNLLASSKNLRNQESTADPVRIKYYEVLTRFAEKGDTSTNTNSTTTGESKKEEIPLGGLQVYLPNFYVLVEGAAKNYELDIQNIRSRKVSTAFIGTMRAILDSKYNEFMLLMEESPKQVSKFCDFVYAWMGKFTVDSITREIRLQHEAEKAQVDDNRVIFLLDLTNPKLQGIWEVVSFKEFLSEASTIDEVYFYLHTRNLLFKGPSLYRHETTFDIYQYIPYEQSEALIDLMMIKFDPVNVMLIKKQLKEKMIVKKTKQLIESGFVLRVLLEFYRIERKNRYKLLKEAFLANSAMGSSGKFCISFPAFKKILQTNFTESTETEISQLYREAYSLGQGSVTVDAFYAIANDSNYFLKYMQLNSYVKIPALNSKGEIGDDEPNVPFRYFYNVYDQLKHFMDSIQHQALQLGVDRLYNEIEDINYQITHNFQQDVTDLRGRPFFLQVNRIATIWTTIKNLTAFTLHLQPTQYNCGFDESNMILKDFDTLNTLLSDMETFSYNAKIHHLEKNNKFRNLQKMCRQKISKFYSFISSLLSAKLKASVKDTKQGDTRKDSIKPPETISAQDPSAITKKQPTNKK